MPESIKTPMAIRGKTLQDASERYHVPMDKLMQMLQEQLDKLQNKA